MLLKMKGLGYLLRMRQLVLLVMWASAAWAQPSGDWFASLYTGDGVELRNDERVFALFSVLNATGFDSGPVTRKDPVPYVKYHPARATVRGKVIGGDPAVAKAANAFFDAHPKTLRRYLTYSLQSAQPPFASGAKAKDLQDLKGLEQVLSQAWTGWKLEELMATVQGDYRSGLRAYLTGVDFPLTRAKTMLKLPESSEAVIVLNLLDAHDSVRAAVGESGQTLVVVGPSEKPNLLGVVREFARLTVEPMVAKHISKWAGGVGTFKEAQLSGVRDETVLDYVSSAISTAVALRALEAPDAMWEAETNTGYFAVKEIARLFDEGRALDLLVGDAMQRLETRRPAKK